MHTVYGLVYGTVGLLCSTRVETMVGGERKQKVVERTGKERKGTKGKRVLQVVCRVDAW